MAYNLIPANKVSSSGLDAERMRMEVAANNIANSQVTSPGGKGLYRRKQVVFETVLKEQVNNDPGSTLGGVRVKEINYSNRKPIEVYNPSHPHADPESGIVKKPQISPLEEMIDMMTATRAYEANLSMMKESKKMAEKTIALGGH
jgi:flagellar basal-body rod protein FlgC